MLCSHLLGDHTPWNTHYQCIQCSLKPPSSAAVHPVRLLSLALPPARLSTSLSPPNASAFQHSQHLPTKHGFFLLLSHLSSDFYHPTTSLIRLNRAAPSHTPHLPPRPVASNPSSVAAHHLHQHQPRPHSKYTQHEHRRQQHKHDELHRRGARAGLEAQWPSSAVVRSLLHSSLHCLDHPGLYHHARNSN